MSSAAGARATVVLVEDSAEVRRVVRRTLESSGLFEVLAEGGDGSAAFSLVDRFSPEVLLLDASMPRLDGIEALPGVLALRPLTKVVLFTGFDEPGLAERARELGAVDVIGKWTPLEELPLRLASALQRPMPFLLPGPPRLTLVREPGGGGGVDLAREQGVLDEHVQQFRELFDRATIGMATLTGNGTVVRANEALGRLVSSSPDELVGVDYGRLAHGEWEQLDEALEAITAGESLATFEHPLPGSPDDGAPGRVRVTLSPIRDSAGHVLYVFAQVQDITALRAAQLELGRSEEMFRQLVAAVRGYAIFMIDVHGMVVSWNSGAMRIKGYTAEEIVGQHFGIFYPASERARGRPERNLETALHEGSFAEEGWRLRKDGTRFWASVLITPVYDDAGVHVGFAKVTKDQSTYVDPDQGAAELTAQERGLMAVTAHELRSPAAVIDGSVSALLASWDQMEVADREALLSGIRTSAGRLRRLASDLTTVSEPDIGSLQLEVQDVSLRALLQAAAGAMLSVRPEVHVECRSDDAVVRVDPVRLGQALDNLLDNAVRHGAPPLTLTASVDRDSIRIRVTDSGAGVDPQLVPRLFQRSAVAGLYGSTGLGLHLVRQVARSHGGEVRYQPPAEGSPTTFEISLPRLG